MILKGKNQGERVRMEIQEQLECLDNVTKQDFARHGVPIVGDKTRVEHERFKLDTQTNDATNPSNLPMPHYRPW